MATAPFGLDSTQVAAASGILIAAVLFLAYLLYGFLRPWLSHEWRREIEEEIGEEGVEEPTEQTS